jgi:sugar/nucleoside kinase (ribokinase family)
MFITYSLAKYLLLQREIPEEINIKACRIAKEFNVKIILDMGGADTPLSSELLGLLDVISPNKTELKRILEKDINVEDHTELIASLHEMRTIGNNPNLSLLLKRGSHGCLFIGHDDTIVSQNALHFSDMPIIDTTGAGK